MTSSSGSHGIYVARQIDQSIANSKIMAHHRNRKAVVYVRQSSPQQVIEHRESSALQYQLVEHAFHLGWDPSQIVVIDEDQGISSWMFAPSSKHYLAIMMDFIYAGAIRLWAASGRSS